jgi:hypothetical protein
MMLHSGWSVVARGRVNPLVPAVVVLAGLALVATGRQIIGSGVAIGAILAYINGVLLSRRVDLAAGTGNAAGALIVMQVGLLFTLAIIGVATIVLVRISLALAVSSAAGFGVAQMAILAAFYFTHGRSTPQPTTEA